MRAALKGLAVVLLGSLLGLFLLLLASSHPDYVISLGEGVAFGYLAPWRLTVFQYTYVRSNALEEDFAFWFLLGLAMAEASCHLAIPRVCKVFTSRRREIAKNIAANNTGKF